MSDRYSAAVQTIVKNQNGVRRMLRLLRFFAGLFLLGYGYALSSAHFNLRLAGTKAQGTISRYQEVHTEKRGLFVFGNPSIRSYE